MSSSSDLGTALIDALDDLALDELADLLAPRIAARTIRAALGSEDKWLTTAEAARYLGVSTNALHEFTAAKTIPFEQDGPYCTLFFRRSELDEWRQAGGARSWALRAG
jgi:excisionase family DNA binding protein